MPQVTIDPDQKILLTEAGIRVADTLARRAAVAPALTPGPDAQGWVALTPQERRRVAAALAAVEAAAAAAVAILRADPPYVTRLGLDAFVRWGEAYVGAAAVLREVFGEPGAPGASPAPDPTADVPPFP